MFILDNFKEALTSNNPFERGFTLISGASDILHLLGSTGSNNTFSYSLSSGYWLVSSWILKANGVAIFGKGGIGGKALKSLVALPLLMESFPLSIHFPVLLSKSYRLKSLDFVQEYKSTFILLAGLTKSGFWLELAFNSTIPPDSNTFSTPPSWYSIGIPAK